jgi:hypothetical protein
MATKKKLNKDRKIAIVVGVLFIIATVAYSFGMVVLDPLLSGSDYLTKASENESQMIIGAILILIDAIAVAAISIVIYPVLKKYNETLALGYVGARLAEGVLFMVNVIPIITLLALSQQFVQAGAPLASHYQTLGAILLVANEWAFFLGFAIAFTLSALILNYLLYQTKLIPRWLAIWGLIGAVSLIAYYGLLSFNINQEILFAPIAVQEMVFAVWLIVKGFNLASKQG